VESPIFITGCSECATLCHTGGEEEITEMKKMLEKNGVEVTGWVVLDPACHLPKTKKLLHIHHEAVQKAKTVLCFTCGNGAQTVAEVVPVSVVSGTDTLSLSEIKHVNEFEERCIMCGTCIIDAFGTVCPIARCPKHMLNGPCGGSRDGVCEINSELQCIWHIIYERLRALGKTVLMHNIQPPKDWSHMIKRGD
jgi:ferredoxin